MVTRTRCSWGARHPSARPMGPLKSAVALAARSCAGESTSCSTSPDSAKSVTCATILRARPSPVLRTLRAYWPTPHVAVPCAPNPTSSKSGARTCAVALSVAFPISASRARSPPAGGTKEMRAVAVPLGGTSTVAFPRAVPFASSETRASPAPEPALATATSAVAVAFTSAGPSNESEARRRSAAPTAAGGEAQPARRTRRRRRAGARRSTPPWASHAHEAVRDHERREDDADGGHRLDERVDGGAGGVLEGVADGVAHDGGLVGGAALAAVDAALEALLGVVPRASGVGHEERQREAAHDGAHDEAAQREGAQDEAHQERRGDGEEAGHDHLLEGGLGDDGDAGRVVGLALAGHDLAVGEL